jgi:hypothetical protein
MGRERKAFVSVQGRVNVMIRERGLFVDHLDTSNGSREKGLRLRTRKGKRNDSRERSLRRSPRYKDCCRATTRMRKARQAIRVY